MPIWLKKGNIIKHENLLLHMKMVEEIITFGDTESEKQKFHY